MAVVYVIAQRTATNDIATQLNALDIGRHELGSVSVGINGVVANEIQFFRETAPAGQPWLTVDRLVVEHPIVELARGTTRYNAIELAGVRASIDAASFDSNADASFDFSQLELPAKQLRLADAQVTLFDGGLSAQAITGIQLSLNQAGEDPLSPVTIEGRIGDLLGNEVAVAGSLDAKVNQLNLAFDADQLNIVTQRWKSMPGLPKGIEANFTADGELKAFRCEATMAGKDLTVDGNAQVAGLEVGLPKFDLPIAVKRGNVHFDSKKIELTELEATVDNGSTVLGRAETNFAEFPILTVFETVGLKELQVQQFKARDVGFDVTAENGDLLLKNFRNANGKFDIDLDGKIALATPHRFEAAGEINKLQLTQLLSSFTSIDAEANAASLTGVLQGGFKVDGQVSDFDWQTAGSFVCLGPTYNGAQLKDIKAKWKISKRSGRY